MQIKWKATIFVQTFLLHIQCIFVLLRICVAKNISYLGDFVIQMCNVLLFECNTSLVYQRCTCLLVTFMAPNWNFLSNRVNYCLFLQLSMRWSRSVHTRYLISELYNVFSPFMFHVIIVILNLCKFHTVKKLKWSITCG